MNEISCDRIWRRIIEKWKGPRTQGSFFFVAINDILSPNNEALDKVIETDFIVYM